MTVPCLMKYVKHVDSPGLVSRLRHTQLMNRVTEAFMFVCLFLLLCVDGWGCNTMTPPDVYSIDPSFTAAEHEVIRDAVSAWCDKVGWCPEETTEPTLWGNISAAHGVRALEHPQDCPAGATCTVNAHNDGANVQVMVDSPDNSDLDFLWTNVAHEIGHFCVDQHTQHGLMSAVHGAGEAPTIDDESARAFRDGCGL